MRNSFLLLFVLSLALSGARADTPSDKAAGQDGDGKAESAAVETTATLRDAKPEYKPPNGYRKKTRDGETVYCRAQKVTGTRFAKTYCYTQMQLEQLETQNESVRRDVGISQQTQGSWDPFGG